MRIKLLLTLILIFTILFIMLLSTKVPQNVKVFELEIEKEKITIGLISDTHIPTRADKLPEKVSEIFKDVDFIIHSGDFVSLSVAEELEKIAPLYAVQGNMDFQEIREKYPKFAIVKVFNHTIGVYHGSLNPLKLEAIARKYGLSVLVSGHTHMSGIRRKETIFINPGSPTNPIFSKRSIGLLRVTKESIEPEIVFV
jgi:hypothetical protein